MIWERVLPTDFLSPSTRTLRRISDPRAAQFWDKGRLVSHTMGERDRGSIVWDYIAIYAPGELWENRPPQPLYAGKPVIEVKEAARAALAHALESSQPKISYKR